MVKKIEVKGRFVNQEEIWRRARNDCPQLHISSSFTGSVLVDTAYLERCTQHSNKLTNLIKLEQLNGIYGIDYIDVEGKPEDTVLSVHVGARFPNIVEYVTTEIRNGFNEFTSTNKIIHRHSKDEELTTCSTSLPIPCGTDYLLIKLPSYSFGSSFLELIFNDPSFTVLELDLTSQILKISCKSAESLEKNVFKVRKQLSCETIRPWRISYNRTKEIFLN